MIEFINNLIPEGLLTFILSAGGVDLIQIELILAGMTILCAGLLKGLAGIGAPMLAIPVLATIYDVPTAISIMVLPLFVSSAWQVWVFRHARESGKLLFPLLSTCAIGVVIGTFLLGTVPDAWPEIVLAVLVFSYVGIYLFNPDIVLSAQMAIRTAVPVGFAIGVLQGAAGVSTPISVTFVHAQRRERAAFMHLMQSIFTVITATQIIALWAFGVMTWILATASVAALVPMMTGLWLGQFLSRFASQRIFERVTLLVLSLIAVALLLKAIPDVVA